MRLYLDTSVFGGYYDEEFAQATRKLFEEIIHGKHIIYLSNITIDELEPAPSKIKNLLEEIPPHKLSTISITNEIIEVAKEYLSSGIITEKYFADALHVASASVNLIDIVVSWNFKHMVNISRIRSYNSVNLRKGLPIIDIRTPKEVLYEN